MTKTANEVLVELKEFIEKYQNALDIPDLQKLEAFGEEVTAQQMENMTAHRTLEMIELKIEKLMQEPQGDTDVTQWQAGEEVR